MMVMDPQQWVIDYKVGQQYRPSYANYNNSNFQLDSNVEAGSTQVWLMGDGTGDVYSKIRNQIYPADQTYSALSMTNMVSGDIETVSITGLS